MFDANRIAGDLPVKEIIGRVTAALADNSAIVVTAPPGAGKSTVLPLTIYDAVGTSGKVVVLEPRRLAARHVAERMAFLLGECTGVTVGYRIRFENRVSDHTGIEVITEGILSRMLLEDPSLEGVSVLIFDEFHERSLASDEALALVRESQRVLRPDLKVVIMSATIDAGSICSALDAPLVSCSGRSYPVDVIYSQKDTSVSTCVEDTARAVLRAHRETEGDILAFLPGESEIRRCAALLQGGMNGTSVCPLYGMLPFEEQHKAVAASAAGERKVVLATSIAETSLTIEGVRTVIDCGLRRTQIYDPQTGQSRLETVPVSRDMADQRSGRAGRTAPGKCFRLYREQTARLVMKEARVPEILEADLVPLALDLAVWGSTAESIPWLTPPPAWKMSAARSVLHVLGAVDASGYVTGKGRMMSAYPCHPRLAAMMCCAEGYPVLAADLAALIEERDPLPDEDAGVDIDVRVAALRDAMLRPDCGRRWHSIARAARQYRKMSGATEDAGPADWPEEGRLLALAYPERAGRLSPDGNGRFILASGDMVFIDGKDPMSESDWIVAVSANVRQGECGRVFLASRVRQSDLAAMSDASDKVFWDSREGAVVMRREWRLGRLLVDSRPIHDVPSERIMSAICEAAGKCGASMFDFSGQTCNLQRRIAAVAGWHPELDLPDLSVQAVLDRAGEWLPVYAGKASTAAELRKLDMSSVLWGMLTYEQQCAVDRIAPSHISVPTGSRIMVEYRQGADAPVVRVRLQECFGLADTPKVDGGRRPVLMELLSPGFKPVQLTSDLANFWKETYFEVRKELRRRYPKHSWPDNPLEAEAVRGVRKKTDK